MDAAGRDALEREVRALCDVGDHARAATALLRGYGPELYGFIAALHRGDGDDVFGDLSMDLWRGLPAFRWDSSLRTWAYALARNASHRARRKQRREVPLDEAVLELAAEVRTKTKSFLRTEVKSKFAALRAALPVEDQELLILRVDRGLAWNDLAIALADGPLDDVTREAARLRKRFSVLKEKLLELGRREGLV
jgi:RNA polymerase sigma-70 factor (ECF subfamily)